MGLKEKISLVKENPLILWELLKLKNRLCQNTRRGIYNFLFQCDATGHFPYLAPYFDQLKNKSNVAVFFTGANISDDVTSFLVGKGVSTDHIITSPALVGRTTWDIYLSPTSWGNTFPQNPDCPRVQLFHTLADKNIQYGENLMGFNHIFVCGPIHHEFLNRYLFKPHPAAKQICTTHNVGYAKIDALINRQYNHNRLRKTLKIKKTDTRKIVLYAPNWELESALHRYEESVFEALKKSNYLVLVKLHYMSLLSPSNVYATGGKDWKKLLDKYETAENMRIVYDATIDPYLSLSDLMITDYGGAAFEYMCTGKPIVYLDCPGFFEKRGTDIMEYWSRDSGYIVKEVSDLEKTMSAAFEMDAAKQRLQKELVSKLLYNPGHGAQTGIKTIFKSLLKPQF